MNITTVYLVGKKKDKEDIENTSLAKRARYYQSLIKDNRLEKIIDNVNS